MDIKVPVSKLTQGMFVDKLDRPWLGTSFMMQGLLIENEDDIAALKEQCTFVYVDPVRSTGAAALELAKVPAPSLVPPPPAAPPAPSGVSKLLEPGHRNAPERLEAAPLLKIRQNKIIPDEHLVQARKVLDHTREMVSNVLADIRNHRGFDSDKVNEAVLGMVESAVSNADALIWLTKLKTKSSYTYDHGIDVAIYLLAFGRHLGFPKADLQLLGIGGLMQDIGKVMLPHELLEKSSELSAQEFAQVKGHVNQSLEILRATPGIPPRVLEIVAQHHERQDGTGYPRGLKGGEIGVFSSMAAIVDCFEAMTSNRSYAPAISSHEALQYLYKNRGTFFHEGLVDQFMQCVGIFPIGSLVELNTGDVGVVVAQNRVRRLKPKLMLLLDPTKKPYQFPYMLDLLTEPMAAGDTPFRIAKDLPAGSYGIDPNEYYL